MSETTQVTKDDYLPLIEAAKNAGYKPDKDGNYIVPQAFADKVEDDIRQQLSTNGYVRLTAKYVVVDPNNTNPLLWKKLMPFCQEATAEQAGNIYRKGLEFLKFTDFEKVMANMPEADRKFIVPTVGATSMSPIKPELDPLSDKKIPHSPPSWGNVLKWDVTPDPNEKLKEKEGEEAPPPRKAAIAANPKMKAQQAKRKYTKATPKKSNKKDSPKKSPVLEKTKQTSLVSNSSVAELKVKSPKKLSVIEETVETKKMADSKVSSVDKEIAAANAALKDLRAKKKAETEKHRAEMNKAIAAKLAAGTALSAAEAKFQQAEKVRLANKARKTAAKEAAGETPTMKKIKKFAHGLEIKVSVGAVELLATQSQEDVEILVTHCAKILKEFNRVVISAELAKIEIAHLTQARKH
jgi:hypothetical protein